MKIPIYTVYTSLMDVKFSLCGMYTSIYSNRILLIRIIRNQCAFADSDYLVRRKGLK